jgi:hypothetical protein
MRAALSQSKEARHPPQKDIVWLSYLSVSAASATMLIFVRGDSNRSRWRNETRRAPGGDFPDDFLIKQKIYFTSQPIRIKVDARWRKNSLSILTIQSAS